MVTLLNPPELLPYNIEVPDVAGALLLNVVQSVDVKYPFTEPVAAAIDITGVVVPVATEIGLVPDTLVTVPPLDGAVFVTVKFGYVPVTLIPVPLDKDTVWSGAVFVIVNVPLDVIGLPVTLIPVPAVAAMLVTVPVVTEPPRLIAVPLMVMLEFVSCELPMPLNVPPSVKLPDDVTVPDKLIPLTVPVPLTDVTVPELEAWYKGLLRT